MSSPELPAGPGSEPGAAMAQHLAMVAELQQRPGACGGFEGEVQLLHTPISTLLLAGDRVFKLKKPVHFAFADFSTLALRHEACLQELRLNQRTAPRHYQGVVAVRRSAGVGTVIHAAGHPAPAAAGAVLVDWAVQMRRFDDQQRFDRLAAAGQLQATQVDALATQVARFHATLPPAPPGYGRPESLRHWARENLLELQQLLAARADAPALAAAVAALQPWCEARGAALAPLMALRGRTGHVREVHGDLHLANVVWADGAPLLFDALEFNSMLRHTDTLGDLSFVFMDLLVQGLPALAWRFINATLEAEGDQAALPLLPWWAAYRAAVRAKVALLGAPPPVTAGGATAPVASSDEPALLHAGHCLAVALGLAGLPQPPGLPQPQGGWPGLGAVPRLLLCAGLSGSGKSTVAALLAQRLGAVRLRSDVERKRLYGLPPLARGGAELYTPQATERTYDRLAELAEAALGAGIPVVVDAASLRRAERAGLQALARRCGARYSLVWCEAPPDELARRVAARAAAGQDASDATPEVLARQQQFAEGPQPDEQATLCRLDTALPLAGLAARCTALTLPA